MNDFSIRLDAAKAGEGWAFDELFQKWNQPITAFVRSRGVRDAEDLVNETFLAAFRGIGSFSGDEQSFRSWLYRIARNKIADDFRKASRRPMSVSLNEGHIDQIGGDVEADALAGLGSERVERLFSTLTDEQREVLVLRIVADLTIDQIAYVTGRRRGAVKQLQRRALRRLEKEVTDLPYPSGSNER